MARPSRRRGTLMYTTDLSNPSAAGDVVEVREPVVDDRVAEDRFAAGWQL